MSDGALRIGRDQELRQIRNFEKLNSIKGGPYVQDNSALPSCQAEVCVQHIEQLAFSLLAPDVLAELGEVVERRYTVASATALDERRRARSSRRFCSGYERSHGAKAPHHRRHDEHVERRRGHEPEENHDGHWGLDLAAGLTAREREREQTEA